jgi:hypothetical protein
MYKVLPFLFIVLIADIDLAYGQRNERLKAELDSIFLVDQQYRTIFSNPRKKDSLAKAIMSQANGLTGLSSTK